MEDISDAGLVHQLRYKFGVRGSIESALETSVMPIVNLGDLDQAPWHSKGAGHWGGTLAAGVGLVNYIGLRAPLTLPPNYRAVIRCAGMAVGTANFGAFLKLSNSAAMDATFAGAVAAIAGAWDSHPDGDPPVRTPLQAYTAQNAAVLAGDGLFIKASTPLDTKFTPAGLVWVIAPGNTLYFQTEAANVAQIATFYWDEYYVA